MQQQEHGKNIEDLDIQFVVDDFEIDGLDFKPVTRGLGFHGEKDRKIPSHKKIGAKKNSNHINQNSPLQSLNQTPETLPLGDVGVDLRAFYGESITTIKEKNNKVKEAGQQEATISSRIVAFSLDTFIVVLSVLLTFSLFYYSVFFNFDFSNIIKFIVMNIDLYLVLNVVVFLSYFTLLDGTGTLGKKTMGIELVSQGKNKTLHVTQLFNRALFCLLGTILFFIPCLLDFHGKISDTKLIKK